MEDYRRNLAEFEARFASDEACRDYLFRLRWPEGFRCPRCGRGKAWPVRRAVFECAHCGSQIAVTAGTIFQDSRLPLTLWFRAMWWVTTQKNGASALGLQRILGLGSYKTAWTWLHKLRRAMVQPGRDQLHGWVEVDETYVGGLEEGVSGRQTETKALVAVACEQDGPGMGRIRLRRIAEASAASLQAFREESVEPGSVVHTDGWEGYRGLEAKRYRHKVTVLKGRPATPSQLMPRVHRVAVGPAGVRLVAPWEHPRGREVLRSRRKGGREAEIARLFFAFTRRDGFPTGHWKLDQLAPVRTSRPRKTLRDVAQLAQTGRMANRRTGTDKPDFGR